MKNEWLAAGGAAFIPQASSSAVPPSRESQSPWSSRLRATTSPGGGARVSSAYFLWARATAASRSAAGIFDQPGFGNSSSTPWELTRAAAKAGSSSGKAVAGGAPSCGEPACGDEPAGEL